MRFLSLPLIALLVFSGTEFSGQPVLASATPRAQAEGTPQAAKIKAQVQKRGAGEKSKVSVTLRNGTMVRGYISKIDESSFEVNVDKTGQANSISYNDVREVQGAGLSKGAKIGIGVAIGVAVVAVIIAVGLHKASNGLNGPI